jgi:hypothetical protein
VLVFQLRNIPLKASKPGGNDNDRRSHRKSA